MKKYNCFSSLIGNDGLKKTVAEQLEANSISHAMMILGEDGCGKNLFARLFAAAYLEDEDGLVERGVHPDCITVVGTGASGLISVESVRDALYELNKSAVTANGRRVAIIKNAGSLNQNSANALLKALEAPPVGVIFLITAKSEDELLATIVSRCVKYVLTPLSIDECLQAAGELFPSCDRTRLDALCRLYDGRLGLVKNALSSPERLAVADCALRFCDAALKADRLTMLSELENASTRDELKSLLFDATMCLKLRLSNDIGLAERIGAITDAIFKSYPDIERNINIKLLCTHLVAQL